jgi:2-amino-4-hydroxy-6-hydroxymethyldihydropteridine diphosphokinase
MHEYIGMVDSANSGEFNAILIALGANLPGQKDSPLSQLRDAVVRLGQAGLANVSPSRFYQTPCFPAGAGPDYINAVVRCDSALPPAQILKILHRIEAEAGRDRAGRWLARVLDLDLLAVGAHVLPDVATFREWETLPLAEQARRAPEHLILPHPRLHERAFVLVPLLDVAPDWVHPVFGQDVRQMLSKLDPDALAQILPVADV